MNIICLLKLMLKTKVVIIVKSFHIAITRLYVTSYAILALVTKLSYYF